MYIRRAPASTNGQELHYPEFLHQRLPNSTLDMRDAAQCYGDAGHLVWEQAAEEYAAIVRDRMQSATALNVPLTVDVGIGENWRDAKH